MSPVLAAILHAVSTLIVIFNSARLVRTGENAAPAVPPAAKRETEVPEQKDGEAGE